MDDPVDLVDVPLHQVARLLRMHGLERARRNELHVDAAVIHVLHVSGWRHFDAVPGLPKLLFAVRDLAAPVGAAVREQAGLVSRQGRWGCGMCVGIDDHVAGRSGMPVEMCRG